MILQPALAGDVPRRARPPSMRVQDLHHRLPPRRPRHSGVSLRSAVVVVILTMWALSFALCIAFPGNEERTKVFQSITVAAPVVISAIFGLSKGS